MLGRPARSLGSMFTACALALSSALTPPAVPPPTPRAQESEDGRPSADLVVAWPSLPRFERPIEMAQVPGQDRRYLLALQSGEFYLFDVDEEGSAGEPREVASIRVSRRHNEEGFLSFALHPQYPQDPRLVVHYSVHDERRGRVATWEIDEQGVPDPESEQVLLEFPQPWRNHNGGQVAFGPDGMLYIGMGDGGSAGDPQQNGQDVSTLLGAILRIDIDEVPEGEAYGVPGDNPFLEDRSARGELWAIGLRNPWRFSFDSKGGALWCADVGQDAFEEVDRIEAGGNYGWRLREGFEDFNRRSRRGPGELQPPVAVYSHKQGLSITGGFVVRGGEAEGLRGHYIYGDYVTGLLWALDADAERPTPVEFGKVAQPASFAMDVEGDLYVLSFDGRIFRFE